MKKMQRGGRGEIAVAFSLIVGVCLFFAMIAGWIK
jgi:hypothetical protein